MTYHQCEYCENEARFICVKCKKDICKDHAVYERDQDGDGEWVCTECHKTNNIIGIVACVVGLIIFIIVAAVMFSQFGNFQSGLLP